MTFLTTIFSQKTVNLKFREIMKTFLTISLLLNLSAALKLPNDYDPDEEKDISNLIAFANLDWLGDVYPSENSFTATVSMTLIWRNLFDTDNS